MKRSVARSSLPGDLVDAFHVLYHQRGKDFGETWCSTRFMGRRCAQTPLDLWVLGEIIYERRPRWIIETGTGEGGSALWYAECCERNGYGQVITIDLQPPRDPFTSLPRCHPRIAFRSAHSTDIFDTVYWPYTLERPIMVILDSDHSYSHVSKELRLYSKVVTPGQYLVVCDTHFNGHPVDPNFGPGPWEAVQKFLREHPEFTMDRSRESHLLTFNPNGYLLKT